MAEKNTPPLSHDEEVFFSKLEARGEASVRADVAANRWGTRLRDVQKWLQLKDLERSAVELKLTKRNVEAAEASAESAKRAADAASKSAQWAFWAVVVAVISTIVAVFK